MGNFTQNPFNYQELVDNCLSTDRIARYQQIGDTDLRDAFARYFRNISLCDSLYLSLGIFEVSLRNSIHRALVQRHGTDMWFDVIGWLDQKEAERVQSVKDDITRRNTPLTAGKIMSELSFGFWVALFNRTYWGRIGPSIQHIFPNAHSNPSLTSLSQTLHRLRKLRNSVYHYEPIWDWSNLNALHAELNQHLRWMNPGWTPLLQQFDRFLTVLGQNDQHYKTQLPM